MFPPLKYIEKITTTGTENIEFEVTSPKSKASDNNKRNFSSRSREPEHGVMASSNGKNACIFDNLIRTCMYLEAALQRCF